MNVPSIESVIARVRPRPSAWVVVVFRSLESADVLTAVVTGAVLSVPVKGAATTSPFLAGGVQGVLVTCDAPRIDPQWARNLQTAIERAVKPSNTPALGVGLPGAANNVLSAIEDASDALRIGRTLGIRRACVSRDDVVTFELLERDPHASRVLTSVLDPITSRRQPEELIRTLEIYLDEGLSISKTATRLNVHRHTVDNRIASIERALARSLERRGDRLVVELALNALRLEKVNGD